MNTLIDKKKSLSESDKERFIDKDTAIKMLETTPRLLSSIGIPHIIVYPNIHYYDIEFIKNLIVECKQFYEEHYTKKEAISLTTRRIVENSLAKIEVPINFKRILLKTIHNENTPSRIVFRKIDVVNIGLKLDPNKQKLAVNAPTDDFNKQDLVNNNIYIPLDDCISILNLPIRRLRKFLKPSDFYLDNFFIGNHRYIKNDDVSRIKFEQDRFLNEYITTSVAKNIYFKDIDISKINKELKRYSPPIFLPVIGDLSNKSKFYKLSELEEFVNNKKDNNLVLLSMKANSGLYMNLTSCSNILRLENDSLTKCLESINAFEDSFYYKNSCYIKNTYVYALKESQDKFLYEHILVKDSKEKFFKNYNYTYIKTKLLTYSVPIYLPCVNNILPNSTFYKISDINNLLNELTQIEKDFFKEFVLLSSAKSTYLKDYEFFKAKKSLKLYDIPEFIRSYNGDSFRKAFKLSDVKDFINLNKPKIIIDYNLYGSTNYDTFLLRLNNCSSWYGFNEQSNYTHKVWFDYVHRTLKNTTQKGVGLDKLINNFIRLSIIIKDILDKHEVLEIYLITSKRWNLVLKTMDTISVKIDVFRFLKYVHSDLSFLKNKKINCCFNIQDIDNPNYIVEGELNDSKNESTIYDFEVYSEVFNYCTNLDMHIIFSIQEIKNTNTVTYVSTWLYVMLHLNNAWRHGDVRDFPIINNIEYLINEAGINNFEWFEENTLDIKIARAIVEKVRQWEIIISKTQVRGAFFCSDELAPSLATAIIILTLYRKEFSLVDELRLMIFNNKHDNVSSNQLNSFFSNLNIKDFTFYSRKFNKTIMSYVYYIANLSGDPKSALYSKLMRQHVDINSTIDYLDFRGINTLTKQLFQRGEFGYVATLLVHKLNKFEIGTFEEVTEQVCRLNTIFNNAQSISTTIGFLNNVSGNYDDVNEYLETKTFREIQELITNLFTRKLTSLEGSDVQCLFGGGDNCKLPDEDFTCFDCNFHIPTVYSLSTLCEYLHKDIDLFFETSNIPKKFQILERINSKKTALLQSIQQLGEDYVYGCLGMPKKDFIDKLIEFNIHSKKLL